MPKKVEFRDNVRNILSDYIGTNGLSVSNFANKYIKRYAEMFGKQEAPSVSTARKLIEWKDTYNYGEKEMRVLENLTGIDFYQLWLENEERILLQKKEEYDRANGTPQPSAPLDSEVTVGHKLDKYSNSDRLQCTDIKDVIQRFTQVETKLPLIVLCDTAGLAEYLIEDSVETPVSIPFDRLAQEGLDIPNNIVYTSIRVSPMSADAGSVVNTAIRVIHDSAELGRTKHVIVVIETMDSDAIKLAAKQWVGTALTLEFHWSRMLMRGWMNIEKRKDSLHPLFEKFVEKSFNNEVKLITSDMGVKYYSYSPSFDKLFGLNHVMTSHRHEDTDILFYYLLRKNCYTYDGIVEFLIRQQNPNAPDGDVKAIQKSILEAYKKKVNGMKLLSAKTIDSLDDCLDKAVLWNPLFKEEIRCWMWQGGSSVVPNYSSSSEWMSFLERQYERQRSFLTDGNPLQKALRYLLCNGLPELWFSEKCDQTSLLTAINAFDEWKEKNDDVMFIILDWDEEEIRKRKNSYKPMLDKMLCGGSVPSLDHAGWMRWFDDWLFDRRSVRKKK